MKLNRNYDNYEAYLEYQKTKTLDPQKRKMWVTTEWDMKIQLFTKLFNLHNNIIQQCKSGLCVCARMGQEVQALRNLGMQAIGIDLVPYEPLVIQGDMHKLSFEDNTFDFVFSNSFDHSLYPSVLVQEIERVLKPDGYCWLILQTNMAGDEYAENDIGSSQDVVSLFQKSGVAVDLPLSPSFRWTYNWELIMRKK